MLDPAQARTPTAARGPEGSQPTGTLPGESAIARWRADGRGVSATSTSSATVVPPDRVRPAVREGHSFPATSRAGPSPSPREAATPPPGGPGSLVAGSGRRGTEAEERSAAALLARRA